jgi:type IX secretion system substrate protein
MKNLPYIIILLIVVLLSEQSPAQPIQVFPHDYTTYLPTLKAGDTLILRGGNYTDGFNIHDIEGTADEPIVIMGWYGAMPSVIMGRSRENSVSIRRSSHVILRDVFIDGRDIPGIDAVKAEGSEGNWAHDITLENLYIRNYGSDQQQVAISTKCPAWNWIIRGCIIEATGTGLYLGNSNGEEPFVNGLIEFNLIRNTIGYNMQVKHQNEGSRDKIVMVENGKTIVRYNVFAKEENASSGSDSRPNLLLGNFPASGDGSEDRYEVYGNFFYANPSEALFQGTGNIALYNNVFVNHEADGVGVTIMEHNGFKPRDIDIFHNTVLVANGSGIRFYNPDASYTQRVIGNAVFAPTPIANAPNEGLNVTDIYPHAGNYIKAFNTDPTLLRLEPLPGMMEGTAPGAGMFSSYTDFDKDFDGYSKDWTIRGAYGRRGDLKRWTLNPIYQRAVLYGITTSVDEPVTLANSIMLEASPNPAGSEVRISYTLQERENISLELYTTLGERITILDSGLRNSGSHTYTAQLTTLPSGAYWLIVRSGNEVYTKLIVKR